MPKYIMEYIVIIYRDVKLGCLYQNNITQARVIVTVFPPSFRKVFTLDIKHLYTLYSYL